MNKKLLIVLLLALCAVSELQAQAVYFNGLGRALVTNDRLSGEALMDTATGIPDGITPRRGTGGYTLLDLGINAQPSENLRAHAILRLRNPFGGFYGDGSFLIFRQLRLDGILSKVVKYQIGDIDLSLTPYTLYNFAPEYHDYEADIFAIRRSIVQYENFNFGNNWRLQGFHANSALKLNNKFMERIGFGAFATVPRRTDFVIRPDRLFIGGEIDVKQSKYLSFGINYARMYDVYGTAIVAVQDFDNDVITFDFKTEVEIDTLKIQVYGELGRSNYSYSNLTTGLDTTNNDWFYDIGASVNHQASKVKLFASYRNVGPDFLSPGAQTRRIFDLGVPSLFSTLDASALIDPSSPLTYRRPILFDRFTDEQLRNLTLSPFPMLYLPWYNNITPYGVATPNRKGLTAGISAGNENSIVTADVIVDLLSEIVAEGVTDTTGLEDTRDFLGLKGGAKVNLGKFLKFEKGLSVNAGFRYERTQREANPVNLTSTALDFGITAELVNKLDLLAGYKILFAEGNESILIRSPLEGGTPIVFDNINFSERVGAIGLRYRFSRNTYFTVNQVLVNAVDENSKVNNYQISQTFFVYTMVF